MPISVVKNMDCMEGMKEFPDNHFYLAIVDPEYGINAPKMQMGQNLNRKNGHHQSESTAVKMRKGRLNSGGGKLKNRNLNTMDCDWDNGIPSDDYFKELFRVSEHQIIWGGNYFPLPPTRGIIAWNKNQPWTNFSQFELAWTSFDCPAKLFTYANRGGKNEIKKIHPTQKPEFLYEYCIKNFAKKGTRILDTHLGSGSHRIVAYKMGFDFYGFEKNKHYFDLSNEYFEKSISEPLFIKEKIEPIKELPFDTPLSINPLFIIER